ncbi:hypothetical protein YC2023_024506 [Brassica napus]
MNMYIVFYLFLLNFALQDHHDEMESRRGSGRSLVSEVVSTFVYKVNKKIEIEGREGQEYTPLCPQPTIKTEDCETITSESHLVVLFVVFQSPARLGSKFDNHSVEDVVVVTREQELVLCRGNVSNSSPSRLKRMLQSLTGMPSATFEGIVTVKPETFFFFAYVC